MTAARELSQKTLAHIQSACHMREIGSPYMTLNSPFGPVGEVRIFAGEKVTKMVYISMTVAQIGLDSHMIFAFTPNGSAVPHFTLDSVMNAPEFAFHLDLIPRVDLGANLDYLMSVFQALDEPFNAAAAIEGLRPARLGPTQYAIMSPWMLAYRANAEAFDAIQAPVDQYLAHWLSLVENGVDASGYSADQLAERDRKNRGAIFNPQVDRVWAQVDRLLGADTSAQMRAILQNQSVESLPS